MSRIGLTILFAILSCSLAVAQDDPEYRMEIGGGLGMMTYEGDFNGSVLSGENTSPAITAVLKRVINPYSAIRFSLGYGKLKGGSRNMNTFYPDFNTQNYNESARQDYKFSNAMYDLSAMYEYNFFPYGTGRDYRGAKRLTPFVAIGLGFSYVDCGGGWVDLGYANGERENGLFGEPAMTGGKDVFTASLPLGFGVKYKVAPRLNLALQWIFSFSLSDKLDGVKDAYRVNSDGLFKNTDGCSTLQLTLTYSFSEKCRTCMNDDY